MSNKSRVDITNSYPSTPCSYILRNIITGHFYIGSTNGLAKRLRDHRHYLETTTHHNSKFNDAFQEWDLILVAYNKHDTVEEARTSEQALLDKHYLDPLCCNLATGVSNLWGGLHGLPEDIRLRMSASQKGKKLTPEHIMKIANSKRGKVMSEDQKIKISNSLKGKIVSDETRRRLSIAGKGKLVGRKRTVESIEKGKKTLAERGGIKHTEESRNKIAKAFMKPVIIDGVEYPSLNDAAREYGLDRRTAGYRVKSKSSKFSGWCYKK